MSWQSYDFGAAGTTVVDGASILTGTVDATAVKAKSLTASQIAAGSIDASILTFTPVVGGTTGSTVVASINASLEGIKISAAKIQIDGTTTFTSGYDPSVALATANSANTLAGTANSTANTASTNASSALSTASTASSTAGSALTAAGTAQTTANTANTAATNLQNNIYYPSTTQINGGNIYTGSIVTAALAAGAITTDKLSVGTIQKTNLIANGHFGDASNFGSQITGWTLGPNFSFLASTGQYTPSGGSALNVCRFDNTTTASGVIAEQYVTVLPGGTYTIVGLLYNDSNVSGCPVSSLRVMYTDGVTRISSSSSNAAAGATIPTFYKGGGITGPRTNNSDTTISSRTWELVAYKITIPSGVTQVRLQLAMESYVPVGNRAEIYASFIQFYSDEPTVGADVVNQLTTVSFGGDVVGPYNSLYLNSIHGRPFGTLAPAAAGNPLVWDGTQWNPSNTPTVSSLYLGGSSSILSQGAGYSARVTTPTGTLDMGAMNTGFAHFYTDRPAFYFQKALQVDGVLSIYGTNVAMSSTGIGSPQVSWGTATLTLNTSAWSPGAQTAQGSIVSTVSGDAKFMFYATAGQLYVYTDGFFYQNEGQYRCIDSNSIASQTVALANSITPTLSAIGTSYLSGITYVASGHPGSSGDGAIYQAYYYGSPSNWGSQIAQDYRNGKLCVRGLNSGSWTSWLSVIDSSTIGSQTVGAVFRSTSDLVPAVVINSDGPYYGEIGRAGTQLWGLGYGNGVGTAMSGYSLRWDTAGNVYIGNSINLSTYGGSFFQLDTTWMRTNQSLWLGGAVFGNTAGITCGFGGTSPAGNGMGVFSNSVGIGRTDPQKPLHVYGTSLSYGMFMLESTGASGSEVSINLRDSAGSNANSWSFGKGTNGIGNNFGWFWGAGNKMTLDTAGNLTVTGSFNYGTIAIRSSNEIDSTTGGDLYFGYATTANIRVGNSAVVMNCSTGTISAIGDVIAYYSDGRLKENVKTIENAVEKVMAIRGVTYNANPLAVSFGYTDLSEQMGVIAQEVALVAPQVVVPAPFDREYHTDGTSISKSGQEYVTVKYDKLVPLLIEAIKEQQAQIDALEARVHDLTV